MSVSEFLLPNCETSETHKELTDEDIITLVMTVDHDEEHSEEDDEGDSQSYSHADHLRAIPVVLSMLDTAYPKELEVYNLLRRKQAKLRSERMIQSNLDEWVNKRN